MSRCVVFGARASSLCALLCGPSVQASPSLRIDCKYYSAEAQLEAVLDQQALARSVQGAEALLLTGDHEHELEAAERLELGDCVLLLLSDREADAQLRLSRRTWSVDNGFECVEVDWGRPFDPGSDPEDPQGLPRVLLALETAQWSSMRRKAKEAPVARPAAEKKDIDNEFWLLDGAHIDQLSDTIAEALQIRREAEEGRFVSDQSRRERAAEVALRLAALMDIDDGDSD